MMNLKRVYIAPQFKLLRIEAESVLTISLPQGYLHADSGGDTQRKTASPIWDN